LKQTPSRGDEVYPLVSLRAEGEAISSFRRGRVNPFVASLPYTQEKQVYVMLNPFGFAPHSLQLGTSPHQLRGTSPHQLRGTSPHQLRGTSQAKLREAPLKAPVKYFLIHLSFRRVESAQ
jgi:hypothetical protein